jgi:hypothetical protein
LWILAAKSPIIEIQVGMLPRDCEKKRLPLKKKRLPKDFQDILYVFKWTSTQYYYGNKYNELPSGEPSRQVGAGE